ncbi:glutaredoxin family protein [Nocardia sp. NPDC055321]
MTASIHPQAPAVVLYSKRGCGQCIATEKAFAARGIPFVKVDVTQDANAAARVRALSYQSLPVVVVGDMHWSGFQLPKIDQLLTALQNWVPSAPVDQDGINHA